VLLFFYGATGVSPKRLDMELAVLFLPFQGRAVA